MSEFTEEAIKEIIKNDIGELVSNEIKIRFGEIQKQMVEWQTGQDGIVEQLKEDRQDINQIKIDMVKGLEQNKVIISNQNHQEDKIVEAVEKATEDIKPTVEASIDNIFQKKSFMQKLVDKITK